MGPLLGRSSRFRLRLVDLRNRLLHALELPRLITVILLRQFFSFFLYGFCRLSGLGWSDKNCGARCPPSALSLLKKRAISSGL